MTEHATPGRAGNAAEPHEIRAAERAASSVSDPGRAGTEQWMESEIECRKALTAALARAEEAERERDSLVDCYNHAGDNCRKALARAEAAEQRYCELEGEIRGLLNALAGFLTWDLSPDVRTRLEAASDHALDVLDQPQGEPK